MKKLYYTIFAAAVLFASCAKEEVSEITEGNEIKKEVKAKIVNGETTVTITTTENGETKTEVLTGAEAEAYMEKDHLSDVDAPAGAKVIVKEIDHSVDVNLDIDDIMNDPEIQGLDEATQEKVRTALEGAMGNMEFDVNVEYTDDESEPMVKTKVVVIDDESK